MIYYVEHARGCSLYEARNLQQALNQAERDLGQHDGPYRGRKATQEDRAWVTGMGGAVNECG